MSELFTADEVEFAINRPGRVTILFTSPSWCPPCRQFEKHWLRAQTQASDIEFHRVSELDDKDWAVLDYGINSQPTVKVYEDGKFVKDVIGAMGALPFLTHIRS